MINLLRCGVCWWRRVLRAASLLSLVLHLSAVAGTDPAAPRILYVDALSGPTSGGENGLGGYLSIFGHGFGSASALGSATKLYIGDAEVANYRYLGPSQVHGRLGIQQLTVQVGQLGNAPAGRALPIRLVVNGVSSNQEHTFYPTAGRVLFVSLSGNDREAMADDINRPWRYLQDNATGRGAYYAAREGDHIVIRGGNWSDTEGVDGTWMRASMRAAARNGRPDAWLHVTSYPGPPDANAPEVVRYQTPPDKPGGIMGPWSAIAGTSGEYWSISNLHMEVSGLATADAAPINLQYSTGHWRVVNNELGPWPVSTVKAARAAGVAGMGDDVKVFGNHIHDIGGTADLENHGIYADGGTTNWEVAFNWIHDISGGSLVQFNDAKGWAGNFRLPGGSVWQGFTGMKVHHNWLENAAKYGITVSDVGSSNGRVELAAWNNVIIGTRLPPLRMNSTAASIDLVIVHNTIYDAMTAWSGTGNSLIRNEGSGKGTVTIANNVLAFGPRTVRGATWFIDRADQAHGWSFRGNLYWDEGRGLAAPALDTQRVVGNPRFTDAPGRDLVPKQPSFAIDKALQPNPFRVDDDLTGRVRRPVGAASDIGAFEALR